MADVTTPATTATPAAAPAVAPAPVAGTPEYEAAMAAKGTPAVEGQPAARPEGLPEKFKSWEDMAKSYAELEKKLGAPAEPAKPATPADPAKPAVPADAKPADSKLAITPEQKAAEGVVAKAGLDMVALSTEFAENGDLKPETYTKLAESGIPKEMVDSYIAGQKAVAAQYEAEAFATANGQENYVKMTDWAKTGMTAGEQQAFNKAVTSGDKDQMKFAVSALKSRYEANFGTTPNLVAGGITPSGDVYESMAQVTTDMKKPEYRKDPAFRARVEAKLGRSDKIGNVVTRSTT